MSAPLLLLAALLSGEAPAPAEEELAPPPAVDAGAPAPLQSAPAPVVAPPARPEEVAPPPPGAVKLHAAAEGDFTWFPSGTPGGQMDVLLDLRPILGIGIGDDFFAEAGAEFRLRMIDAPPGQRDGDIGGVLRRKDWDEASDFGQIIRSLRIGHPDTVFWIEAGPVRKRTLGLGHLISRYSNQDNPDYHPAGATIGVAYKAFNVQLFASDVFGPRIFAGELALDLGRIIGNSESVYDRFHLGASLAHDVAQAGGITPPATLAEFDFDAVVYRNRQVRLMLLTGFGTRFKAVSDLGLVLGAAVDATLSSSVFIGGKVELRKQAGGYRQGFFGPGYELARFAGIGFSGVPRADENLPDGFSVYGEVHLARGTQLSLDGSIEHFFWGRTDADAVLSLALLGERLLVAARFTGIGIGQVERYAATSEVRARILGGFYVLAAGGTVFFPQPDHTLVRGFYVGAGAGLDFER